MVRRVGGARRGSRCKLKKSLRERSKTSISKFLQTFNTGDKVILKAEPSVQKGMFELRFYGKVGTVVGKAGRCYNVAIMDQNKAKTLIVHPVHLKRM
jgi:large subunit ribosomal protein L21e